MASTNPHSFDALSDAHYQVIGRLLVMRNEFIYRCTTILIVAQFGIESRGPAGQALGLHDALSCGTVVEMTKRVKNVLSSCSDKMTGLQFESVVQSNERLLGEIDQLIAGRWGLVDFAHPDKPVLYTSDRSNLPTYAVSDIERVLGAFLEMYVELKPFLYPPN